MAVAKVAAIFFAEKEWWGIGMSCKSGSFEQINVS